jgi:hypothetical protein
MFVVAEPAEGKALPTPQEVLGGAQLQSLYGTLELSTTSRIMVQWNDEHTAMTFVYATGRFGTGMASVRCTIKGTYTGNAGDILYLT